MNAAKEFIENFFINNPIILKEQNLSKDKFIEILKSLTVKIKIEGLENFETIHQKLINNDINDQYKTNFYDSIIRIISNFTGIGFKKIQPKLLASHKCMTFHKFCQLVEFFTEFGSCFLNSSKSQSCTIFNNLFYTSEQNKKDQIYKINKDQIYEIIQEIIQEFEEPISQQVQTSQSNESVDLEMDLSLAETLIFDILSLPIQNNLTAKINICNNKENYLLNSSAIAYFNNALVSTDILTQEEIEQRKFRLISEGPLFCIEPLSKTNNLKEELNTQYKSIFNNAKYLNLIENYILPNNLNIQIKIVNFLISNSGKKLQDIDLYKNVKSKQLEIIYSHYINSQKNSIKIGNLILAELIKIIEIQKMKKIHEKLQSIQKNGELLHFLKDHESILCDRIKNQEECNQKQYQINLNIKFIQRLVGNFLKKFNLNISELLNSLHPEPNKNFITLQDELYCHIEDYSYFKLQYIKLIKLSLIIEDIKEFSKNLQNINYKIELDYHKQEIICFFDFINNKIKDLNKTSLEKNLTKFPNEISEILEETKDFHQFYNNIKLSLKSKNIKYQFNYIPKFNNQNKNKEQDNILNLFKDNCENKLPQLIQINEVKNFYFENLIMVSKKIHNLQTKINEENKIQKEQNIKLQKKPQFNKIKKISLYIFIPLIFTGLEMIVVSFLDKFCKINLGSNNILIASICVLAISLIIARIIHKEWEQAYLQEQKMKEPTNNVLYDSYQNIKESFSPFKTLKKIIFDY